MIRVQLQEWTIVYSGGRLADVTYGGHAVDAIDVWPGDYFAMSDDQRSAVEVTRSDVLKSAREWVRDCADDYRENALPYLV